MKTGCSLSSKYKTFYLNLGLALAVVVAGQAGAAGKPLKNGAPVNAEQIKKYIKVGLPLNAQDVSSIEVIVSLPRVENTYGHTASRIRFKSGAVIEAGYVVENFKDQQENKGGSKPVLVEIYPTSSGQAMYRRREFKLEYATLLLSEAEKVKYIENLNQDALNGTGETYKLLTNNCATMEMKLIKRSLIGRGMGTTSNPGNVASSLASDNLIDAGTAKRIDQNFAYYKKNPYNPNAN